MTVKSRLMLLIGTAAAGILVLLALLVRDISSVYKAANFANENTVPSLQALGEADHAIADLRVSTWKHLETTDPATVAKIEADLAAAREELVKTLDHYQQSLVADERDGAGLHDDRLAIADYDHLREHVLELSRAGKKDEARELLLKSQPLIAKATDALNAHKRYNSNLGVVGSQEAARTRVQATVVSASVGVLLLLVLGFAGFRTIRWLNSTLGGEPSDVAGIARDVASGNLSSKVNLQPGDTGSLLATVAQMQTDLKARIESDRAAAARNDSLLEGINKAMAQIDFDMDGTIRHANANFLQVTGYTLEELRGKHHSVLVDPVDVKSAAYRDLWDGLRAGRHHTNQFRRLAKGGREIWLQATYSPILDGNGKPFKVAKFAIDVTETVRTAEEVRILAQSAASGDLTRRIPTAGKTGNLLALSQAINTMADSMANIVSQIRTAVEAVRTGTEEISNGNTNLSQRTEQQASSLEETASSMEEMTSTVKQNADNAAQASQLATAARNQAEKGGAVVSEAVNAMTGINEASRRIADIIGVIDEIAFQTNLLALNAAVEAARAGEQGRGFAVVAAEVRTLASRSATAAKEIKELIQDSVARVEHGSRLVGESGQSLSDIVTAVKKASDIVAEIAAACQEQARGIDQVNKAITALDQVTQQNAALVEEAASAAETLTEEAQLLDGMMANYQIAGTGIEGVGRASATAAAVAAAAEPRMAKATGSDGGGGREARTRVAGGTGGRREARAQVAAGMDGGRGGTRMAAGGSAAQGAGASAGAAAVAAAGVRPLARAASGGSESEWTEF